MHPPPPLSTAAGREPDYTSSHMAFMDTCDYLFFTPEGVILDCVGESSGASSSSAAAVESVGVTPAPAGGVQSLQGDVLVDGQPHEGRGCPSQQQQQASKQHHRHPPRQQLKKLQQPRLRLRPTAVLAPPDGLCLPRGLPTRHMGSDHVCLVARYELRVSSSALFVE